MKTKTKSLFFAFAVAALMLRVTLAQDRSLNPLACRGMCDASAIAILSEEHFVVGDDEDNILRVYSRLSGGKPVAYADLGSFLRVDRSSPEADLEGAAELGDEVYWISSHGRNKDGKLRVSRHRFFATRKVTKNGMVTVEPIGKPYRNLLQDLVADPRLKPFNLQAAALKEPKEEGALNIEGLSATPEGHLLIGLRNPIINGKALLIPLLNPKEVVAGTSPARLGDPQLVDLGGLGIRSITHWKNQYFIIAGSYDGGGRSRLFTWDGGHSVPKEIKKVSFAGLNPEAIAPYVGQDGEGLLMVSDDGTRKIGKKPCKSLKNPDEKQFRTVQVPLSLLQAQ